MDGGRHGWMDGWIEEGREAWLDRWNEQNMNKRMTK